MSNDDDLAEDVAESLLDLIPGAGPLGMRLVRAVREEHKQRVSEALRAAERLSGKTREELAEEIAGDPDLVPLLTRLLYAAGVNGYTDTLKALGRTFGHAVLERARIGECDLILTALADVRAEHIVVLRVLAEPAPRQGPPVEQPWYPELVIGSSPLEPRMTRLCLAALTSRGLASQTAPLGIGAPSDSIFAITEIGRVVLEVIDEVERETR